MNYIGSKLSLLEFLDKNIMDVISKEVKEEDIENMVFCDAFAGTGVVGHRFKEKGMKVISNDIQYYSYVLNKHLISNNKLQFKNLEDEIPELKRFSDTNDKIECVLDEMDKTELVEGFIYDNYTYEGTKNKEYKRLYFTEYNAKKCDAIRLRIEDWYNFKKINKEEYYTLIACLIESIDKYANTASVYGSFLKKIKRSASKKMKLENYGQIIDNKKNNKVFNEDINEIINDISGDILYLDPPYNGRQYHSNYHMLETIAKYDYPELKGKTGLRKNEDEKKSLFCSKINAKEELNTLIKNANFKYIFMSYNNEGIIDIDDIKEIFSNNGDYKLIKQPYKRFKANNRKPSRKNTIEYLHCLIK